MKVATINKLLLLSLVLTASTIGCKKSPTPLTPLPNGKPLVGDDTSGKMQGEKGNTSSSDNITGTPLNARDSHAGWNENAEVFKAYTVHFDYDSSAVKASEKSKIESVASQMKSDASSAVRVEGHCDERGTEEYNRSLGEKRAIALREELIRLGIDPTRVDTISYGEDRPVDPGHDEAAWKKNRRGEFIQLTPPK